MGCLYVELASGLSRSSQSFFSTSMRSRVRLAKRVAGSAWMGLLVPVCVKSEAPECLRASSGGRHR